MPARLVPCPDAFALEEAFLDELAACSGARRDLFSPIWVVAPTRILLDRLQLAAARRLGAVAGVVWLTYRALAQRIVESAGGDPVAVMPQAAWEAVVGDVVRATGGPLADWAARFPAAAGALATTLRELREAGLPGEALAAHPLAGAARELDARMARAEEHGVGDEASLLSQACRLVSAALPPVIHAGAYDLTGITSSLFGELARRADLVHLTLGTGTELETLAFAEERSGSFGDVERSPPRPFGGPWAHRLVALRSGDEAPEFDVAFAEAPGPAEELAVAARRCLRWAGEGIPLEEIAIVARSLEPYEGHVRATLHAWRLPFFTTAEAPLARQPAAQALRDLLQVLATDLARAPLARLIASPYFRRDAAGAPMVPGRLDVLMRRLDYRGGSRDLAERLPVSARQQRDRPSRRRDLADAALLAELARGLGAAALEGSRARSIPALVAFVRAVAGRYLEEAGSGRELATAVAAVCRLADLDGLVPAPADLRALAGWSDRALALQTGRLTPRDLGGVRVLDMMQARGLSFRAVALLGVHAGSIPRLGHEDPLLGDELRAELQRGWGRRIPPRAPAQGDREEWLLLALALSSAAEKLLVCRQSVDEAQRERAASPWLPAILRATGSSRAPRRIVVPRHPLGAAIAGAREDGLLTAPDAVVASALSGSSVGAAARALEASALLDGADELLAAGIAHTARVEERSVGDVDPAEAMERLAFDGVVAPAGGPLELTASALERLVRCPMRYFLQDRLEVVGHDRPEDSPLVDRRRLGSSVHELLDAVYRDLPWDRPVANILAVAQGRLGAALSRMEASLGSGLLGAYPPVLRAVVSAVEASARDLVAWDLPRIALAGVASLATEEPFEAPLTLDAATVLLRGRLDRRITLGDGTTEIADTKTATSAEVAGSWIRPRRILATGRVQLAAYGLAWRASRTSLALLHVPVAMPGVPSDRRHHVLDGATLAAHAGELRSSMSDAVLVERRGLHPLTRHGAEVCRICDYRVACRYDHGPTLERVDGAEIFAPYRGGEAASGAVEGGGD